MQAKFSFVLHYSYDSDWLHYKFTPLPDYDNSVLTRMDSVEHIPPPRPNTSVNSVNPGPNSNVNSHVTIILPNVTLAVAWGMT